MNNNVYCMSFGISLHMTCDEFTEVNIEMCSHLKEREVEIS